MVGVCDGHHVHLMSGRCVQESPLHGLGRMPDDVLAIDYRLEQFRALRHHVGDLGDARIGPLDERFEVGRLIHFLRRIKLQAGRRFVLRQQMHDTVPLRLVDHAADKVGQSSAGNIFPDVFQLIGHIPRHHAHKAAQLIGAGKSIVKLILKDRIPVFPHIGPVEIGL